MDGWSKNRKKLTTLLSESETCFLPSLTHTHEHTTEKDKSKKLQFNKKKKIQFSVFTLLSCLMSRISGINCSMNWAVCRSWEGAGDFPEIFQAPPVTNVFEQKSQSHIGTLSHLRWPSMINATVLCHRAPRQERGSIRKNPVRSCVGLTSFCNTETMLPKQQMTWYANEIEGIAALVLKQEIWPGCKNTHSWCFFIYLNFIYSAAVTGCSSFVYGHPLSFHSRSTSPACQETLCPCLRMCHHGLQMREYNGIRWRWTSDVSISWSSGHISPAGLLTNNSGMIQLTVSSLFLLEMIVFFSYKDTTNHIYMNLVELMGIS